MADTLLVSTRKGLFVIERRAGRWEIANTAFLGDKLALALVDPRDGSWYAALDLGHFGAKLQRSTDRGASWTEIGVPEYPDGETVVVADGKPPQPAKLSLIWALEAGGVHEPGRLWAGTIPGGLFRSDDHGVTWSLVRSLWDRPERSEWFGAGADGPGLHSICVDARDARRLRIALSSGGVWRSDDGGANWRNTSEGFRAEYMPPERAGDPNAQDIHHLVQCPADPDTLWAQHHNGVFKTIDGGERWQEITNVDPSVFGFAVAVHPFDPKTAWFVPAIKDERRIPVNGEVVVARTRDGGASFQVLRNGLPQRHAYDLVYRHALAVDDTGERLAFGSTTGGLWISENGGDAWSSPDARLPPVYAVAFA